mmetsp:Transcript_150438/g.273770  ORF Transcript_150438/g.273770 Transcript_150438/m.273770 type:complete len:248 (+) Transcript_150438:776-1519(+)
MDPLSGTPILSIGRTTNFIAEFGTPRPFPNFSPILLLASGTVHTRSPCIPSANGQCLMICVDLELTVWIVLLLGTSMHRQFVSNTSTTRRVNVCVLVGSLDVIHSWACCTWYQLPLTIWIVLIPWARIHRQHVSSICTPTCMNIRVLVRSLNIIHSWARGTFYELPLTIRKILASGTRMHRQYSSCIRTPTSMNVRLTIGSFDVCCCPLWRSVLTDSYRLWYGFCTACLLCHAAGYLQLLQPDLHEG